jgi:Sec-independent protein translocase protein TatA
MFGFSIADWIFIVVVMVIIFACIGISDMRKGTGKRHSDGE